MSKLRCKAALGVHSSMSNVGSERFSSWRQTAMHSSKAFWIFWIWGVRGIESSVTVGGEPVGGSNDVAMST
jgi:hypothetical protein